ncbi:hypothetical protein EW146_g364 [Bondarzewia mesenterica]|uniref:FAD-binding domain-containing protein n=1 Tax=Bondarzewia mesenterica TaxID=1095465 RepID=A0A4S4M9I2_9AGAM|nr:hypothetical protein EW146_g364 [Bondarzewia mesenterica]
MEPSPKFRVAICGGGPGGLALAATLMRFNDPTAPIAVEIYEAQPSLGTRDLWVLPTAMQTKWTKDTIFFKQNTPADVLIGSDGIRSTVRSTMLSEISGVGDTSSSVNPVWTGTTAYRALIKRETLNAVWKDHRTTHLPVIPCHYRSIAGALINFVGFRTVPDGYGKPFEGKWVHDVSAEEVRACYAGFEPEVQALLKCFDKASAWAIHAMDDVSRCAVGSVAVLGDAVHAMLPHFGAGAGQALEDAYVLGRLLTHPLTTHERIDTALAIYQDIRLEFAKDIVSRTRKVGMMYEFGDNWGPPPA